MEKKAVCKFINVASFVLVVLGGLIWLMIGLFKFDMIAWMFGGMQSVASRIIYTLFGLGAAALITTVLVRVFKSNTKKG